MTDIIYQHPADYDLEHEGDERDIAFYRELVRRWSPARVLDLACGSGRITLPLAEQAATQGFDLVGVDIAEEMLQHAREKCRQLPPDARRRLRFVRGDMRTWSAETTDASFDVVLITCSSITHLLSLEDQLATWRGAAAVLRPGGRLVVDVTMPNLRAFAESLQMPPRALLEVDLDATDDRTERRLVRYKATTFDAFAQRASIRFFYDRFQGHEHDRYLSDFESHVYFPRELQLLFLHAGFEVEATWADYAFRRPRPWSRELIMAGRLPR
jgi:ubiquinone/menaquinone biosynthesis C-methylase UbiE